MCFRSPQILLGAVALIAQRLLIESSMHGHRQVADPVHFDTIGGAFFQDELRGSFAFQAVDQKDDRDVLLHLMKNVQYLCFLPVGAGVLGHHEVIGVRTEPFGELFGSYNYL